MLTKLLYVCGDAKDFVNSILNKFYMILQMV